MLDKPFKKCYNNNVKKTKTNHKERGAYYGKHNKSYKKGYVQ